MSRGLPDGQQWHPDPSSVPYRLVAAGHEIHLQEKGRDGDWHTVRPCSTYSDAESCISAIHSRSGRCSQMRESAHVLEIQLKALKASNTLPPARHPNPRIEIWNTRQI